MARGYFAVVSLLVLPVLSLLSIVGSECREANFQTFSDFLLFFNFLGKRLEYGRDSMALEDGVSVGCQLVAYLAVAVCGFVTTNRLIPVIRVS